MLFPPQCLHCRLPLALPEHRTLCEPCFEEILPKPRPLCGRCGREGIFHHGHCRRCQGLPRSLYKLSVAYQREIVASALLADLENGVTPLAYGLGALMVLDHLERELPYPDFIVPIPGRSFLSESSALLIANAMATMLERPLYPLFSVDRWSLRQRDLSDGERLQNKVGLVLKNKRALKGMHLLLVDDEIRTGETLDQAASLLLPLGVKTVSASVWKRG